MNPYQPLKIIHQFPYTEDMDLEEKQRIIRDELDSYIARGFAGIVTNVSFFHYLQSEEEWQMLRYVFDTCREKGLRTWIYDEKGYPSGKAGGLTLKGHPEWQAQALAMKAVTFGPGEKIEIAFPYLHSYIYAAYAYRTDSLEHLTDEELLLPWKRYDLSGQEDLRDINTTDGPVTAVLFLRRTMYEGSHALHNTSESARYIDISNKDAVDAFISNTYDQYVTRLKDTNPIESFFTDEPSLMGAYLNLGMFPPKVVDEFDETMDRLPCISWGHDIHNRFHSTYGYDLTERVAYLFCGNSMLAKQTRMDYYQLLSDLCEQNFFANISDYCASHNQKFSGHLLLEDDIRFHPILEGNVFSLLRHMHIPGIDMLHGVPEYIRNDAFTPKLISSIAHAYNRPHVMSEISAHQQGGKVTPEQFLGCMYTQYVLGIDTFHSYFTKDFVDEEQYLTYNQAIGRVCQIMGNRRHVSGVALYYPIETIQAGTIPYADIMVYSAIEKNHDNTVCWNSIKKTMNTLMDHQIDYDFVDTYVLERSTVENGHLRTMGGEDFEAFVIPACMITPRLRHTINRLRDHGVSVIIVDSPEFKNDVANLGVQVVKNEFVLPEILQKIVKPVIRLDHAPQILYLCKENDRDRIILAVNTTSEPVRTTATVQTLGETISLYDPLTEKKSGSVSAQDFTLALAPYSAILILPETN